MANDDNKSASWFRRVNNQLDTLDINMDGLYQTTYSSRTDNKKELNRIVGSIDDTVDKLINDGDGPKISDISNLYARIQKKNGVSNNAIMDSAMELFSDNTIINSLSESMDLTKFIQSEDYQYDMICKYMPSIETALEIKKDNVLSSDNFSKDFLNVSSNNITKDRTAVFNDKARKCLEKYKFQDFCEEMYQRAAKYGECFVYCVPYNVALQRLMDRKTKYNNIGLIRSYGESKSYRNSRYQQVSLLEGAHPDKELSNALSEAKLKIDGLENFNVNLIFDDYGIYADAVESRNESLRVRDKSKLTSLTEAYNNYQETGSFITEVKDDEDSSVTFNSVYKSHKSSDTLDGGVNDGLYVDGTRVKSSDGKIQELNGAVLDFIDREDILPIYMDNLCVGYYYFQFNELNMNTCIHGHPNGGTDSGFGMNNPNGVFQNGEMANDMLLSFISQKISDNIDSHFINANKDLKEEIYAILKYNDKFAVVNGTNNITVSFLPADDVYHFFLQQDRKTHRGISCIKKSVVPAMMYCLLYLTTTIGQVTRGQDKRVYYVKQNVETNVARTLMNVINQIKRGNFGMRQIESMNSILGIVGKYNDFVIPVGQSGDPPIDFQIMQGQEINTPSELMDRFENQAVEGTDVPYEFVQSVNNVDYATRFSMSNSKFLRKVYKEQRICQEAFSYLFTKLYNYEYLENERVIKVQLPAPAFLSMSNTQQLIDSTKNYVNAIIESEIGQEDDKLKGEVLKILMRNQLGSYIDYSMVDTAIEQAKLNLSMKSNDEDNGGY